LLDKGKFARKLPAVIKGSLINEIRLIYGRIFDKLLEMLKFVC